MKIRKFLQCLHSEKTKELNIPRPKHVVCIFITCTIKLGQQKNARGIQITSHAWSFTCLTRFKVRDRPPFYLDSLSTFSIKQSTFCKPQKRFWGGNADLNRETENQNFSNKMGTKKFSRIGFSVLLVVMCFLELTLAQNVTVPGNACHLFIQTWNKAFTVQLEIVKSYMYRTKWWNVPMSIDTKLYFQECQGKSVLLNSIQSW